MPYVLSIVTCHFALLFPFRRRKCVALQHKVKVCYAMTINRSQGQTLSNAGNYPKKPVFSDAGSHQRAGDATQSLREAINKLAPPLQAITSRQLPPPDKCSNISHWHISFFLFCSPRKCSNISHWHISFFLFRSPHKCSKISHWQVLDKHNLLKMQTKMQWVYNGHAMVHRNVNYIPILQTIFDEILMSFELEQELHTEILTNDKIDLDVNIKVDKRYISKHCFGVFFPIENHNFDPWDTLLLRNSSIRKYMDPQGSSLFSRFVITTFNASDRKCKKV
jgi:hypothetical protein